MIDLSENQEKHEDCDDCECKASSDITEKVRFNKMFRDFEQTKMGEALKYIRAEIRDLNLEQKLYWYRDENGIRLSAVCLIKDSDDNIARGVSFWNVEEDNFSAIQAKYYAIKRALRAYKKGTDFSSEIRNDFAVGNPDGFKYKSDFIAEKSLTGQERKMLKIAG